MSRHINLNRDQLRGELLRDKPLAGYTSWRAGGSASVFFRPADIDDLQLFLRGMSEDEPMLWLGLGSNLLIRDGGFNGTVIATSGVIGDIQMASDTQIDVGAGVSCNKLARYSVKHGLSGGEFFVGIPGTLGGALAMNAGAWGGETWPLVERVESIDRAGIRRVRNSDDYQTGYRSVQSPPGEWFIGARLNFQPAAGDPGHGQELMRKLLAERAESQPTGVASAGSVFRNPAGDHAARLIEASGLKGRCHGAACVSEQHANFIINSGDARAADIESLIEEVQVEVEKQQGIHLQPEVCIVGEPA